jgi:hypothetical protein
LVSFYFFNCYYYTFLCWSNPAAVAVQQKHSLINVLVGYILISFGNTNASARGEATCLNFSRKIKKKVSLKKKHSSFWISWKMNHLFVSTFRPVAFVAAAVVFPCIQLQSNSFISFLLISKQQFGCRRYETSSPVSPLVSLLFYNIQSTKSDSRVVCLTL